MSLKDFFTASIWRLHFQYIQCTNYNNFTALPNQIITLYKLNLKSDIKMKIQLTAFVNFGALPICTICKILKLLDYLSSLIY